MSEPDECDQAGSDQTRCADSDREVVAMDERLGCRMAIGGPQRLGDNGDPGAADVLGLSSGCGPERTAQMLHGRRLPLGGCGIDSETAEDGEADGGADLP